MALQHDDGPDSINNNGSPISLSKSAQYNRNFIDTIVVQTIKHKVKSNENDTYLTDSTGNPRTTSKSIQHNKNLFSKNESSTGIGRVNEWRKAKEINNYQRNRDSINSLVALDDSKMAMINDNDTDSIDIKEIPQFLSKVAQHII